MRGFGLTRRSNWSKKGNKVFKKGVGMEIFVKRLEGKNFQSGKLKDIGLQIETLDEKLYKVWTPVEEFEKDDIFKRIYKGDDIVKDSIYVQKPAYLNVNSNYVDVFSFDERSFFGVAETVRKVFDFNERILPGLDKFHDDAKVEYVHFHDQSSHSEVSIRFDGPKTMKELLPKLPKGTLNSFTVQMDYKKNGLYVNGLKLRKNAFELYFLDKDELDASKEIEVVKTLSKIIEGLYKEFKPNRV